MAILSNSNMNMKKRVTCSIHNLLLQSVILSVSLTRGVESFDAIVTENELSRDFLSARIQYEQVDQIAPSMSTYRFRNVYNNNGTTFDKHSQSPLPMDAKEIVTSRWWRAIQNAEEKYDSVLQIVLLAPEWNGEAFSLAKEVESLARSGRKVFVEQLSPREKDDYDEVSLNFVWISDESLALETKQNLCGNPIVVHRYNGSINVSENDIQPVTSDKMFVHTLQLPLMLLVQRKRHSEATKIEYKCYHYGGPWNGWQIISAVAKLAHQIRWKMRDPFHVLEQAELERTKETSQFNHYYVHYNRKNEAVPLARLSSMAELDSLRSSYPFVFVAYINCDNCQDKISRLSDLMSIQKIEERVQKFNEEIQKCNAFCTSSIDMMYEVASRMFISSSLRFAIVDSTNISHYEHISCQQGQDSCVHRRKDVAELFEKVYSYNGNVDAHRFHQGVVDFILYSSSDSPISYPFQSAKDLGIQEIISWLALSITKHVDVVDKDGVSLRAGFQPSKHESLASTHGIFDTSRTGNNDPRSEAMVAQFVLFVDERYPFPELFMQTDEGAKYDNLGGDIDIEQLRKRFKSNDMSIDEFRRLASDHLESQSVCTETDESQLNTTQLPDSFFSIMPTSLDQKVGTYAQLVGVTSLPSVAGIVYSNFQNDSTTNLDVYGGGPEFYVLQLFEESLNISDTAQHISNSFSSMGMIEKMRTFLCAVINGNGSKYKSKLNSDRQLSPKCSRKFGMVDMNELTSSDYNKMLSLLNTDVDNSGSSISRDVGEVKVQLLLLHAPYCAFCARARAVLSHLSRDHDEQRSIYDDYGIEINFLQLDCEMNSCDELEYLSSIDFLPTILLFVDRGLAAGGSSAKLNEPYIFQGKLDRAHVIKFVKSAVNHHQQLVVENERE